MGMHKYEGLEGIFEFGEHNSRSVLKHYRSQGWVLLKEFYNYKNEILPVHREVNSLISLKLKQTKLSPVCDPHQETIHTADFIQLCKHDREKGGEIYRATRHLCELHKMLVKAESIELAQRLMSTRAVNIIPYIPIRIDLKNEEKYLFDWHQDYPYTQGSMDGIVIWSPLFDVRDGDGGIKLIPASHTKGLRSIEICDPQNANKNGAHTIKIHNTEEFENQDSYTLDVEAGDALVFSTLLLHKSIPQVVSDCRWTTQFRYANFSNSDAVERGWPGGMIEGNSFEKDHAEYVVKTN